MRKRYIATARSANHSCYRYRTMMLLALNQSRLIYTSYDTARDVTALGY